MLEKIVSGGQTGVDQAALCIAIDSEIPYGGWCPKGRLAEDGEIHEAFSELVETQTNAYGERTVLNLQRSDGRLIIVSELPIKVTDGTILTIEKLREEQKPYCIVSLSNDGAELDSNDAAITASDWRISLIGS